MATKKSTPSWSDVKTRLAGFDHAGLTRLVHDLYAASKDNQAFLHARFNLGVDVLKPYKATIERWLYPDVLKDHRTSVVNAKKAISDYRKAVGQPEGLAELMVFFCERAVEFCNDCRLHDEGFFDALVRMFEQALKTVTSLPDNRQSALLERLDAVRDLGHNVRYDVGADMDYLLLKYGFEDEIEYSVLPESGPAQM